MFVTIFFLIIVLMFLVIVSIIGDTLKAPWSWAGVGVTFGIIYAWLLDSWWNFKEFILIPAWNTMTLKIVPGVYEFGAVIFVIGLGFYIIMMLRTAYISWTKEGILTLAK